MLRKLLIIFLAFYEKHFLYRIKPLWGEVCKRNVGELGEDVRFHGYVRIIFGSKLKIGSYTRIGERCFLFCKGGLSIGENCQFSRGITIYTANHDVKSLTSIPYDNKYLERSVNIGNSVWIGMNASILPGVTIGDGAVIGMGAIITKDVPEGAMVVGTGSAQRIIGYRNIDLFRKLKEEEKYFGRLYSDL